jgi:hypothetical protein
MAQFASKETYSNFEYTQKASEDFILRMLTHGFYHKDKPLIEDVTPEMITQLQVSLHTVISNAAYEIANRREQQVQRHNIFKLAKSLEKEEFDRMWDILDIKVIY